MHYAEQKLIGADGRVRLRLYHSALDTCVRPFTEHHHTACELSLINRGSGVYTTKDGACRFSEGDVFLFGSDEVHCITVIDKEPFDVTNIHFEPFYVWSADGIGSPHLLTVLFDKSCGRQNRFSADSPLAGLLAEHIRGIEKELSEKSYAYTLAVREKLCASLIALSRAQGVTEERKAAPFEDTAAGIGRVLHYLEEHLSETLTLDTLAAVCGMNRTYFCSVFKRFNGISPWDYLTIKRVEKAVVLLRTTDRKIADIALECGFNSQSNFYKAFTKVTGRVPSEYRMLNAGTGERKQ